MSRDTTLEDLASNRSHCCCAYANIVLTRSLCAPDPAYVHEWAIAILRYARTQPQGLGLLVLIDAAAQPPNEAERTTIKNGYMKLRSVVRGAVQVIEGEGFMASAMRGALTITNLAAGIGFPIKVAGTVSEAVPLLTKTLGSAMDPRLDAAGLTRAAADIRARLTA
jgi:hypothetical protein